MISSGIIKERNPDYLHLITPLNEKLFCQTDQVVRGYFYVKHSHRTLSSLMCLVYFNANPSRLRDGVITFVAALFSQTMAWRAIPEASRGRKKFCFKSAGSAPA